MYLFTNVIVIFYRARHARSNSTFNYLLYNRVSTPKMIIFHLSILSIVPL